VQSDNGGDDQACGSDSHDGVELVPARDVNDIGALTAARFVCKGIGCIARQRGRAAVDALAMADERKA